jgi:hypothetical protein
MPSDHPESLRPILRQAEEQLSEQLREVCPASDVSAESTGEVIRLEEQLSLAAEVAKQIVSLRLRIRQIGDVLRGARPGDGHSPPTPTP